MHRNAIIIIIDIPYKCMKTLPFSWNEWKINRIISNQFYSKKWDYWMCARAHDVTIFCLSNRQFTIHIEFQYDAKRTTRKLKIEVVDLFNVPHVHCYTRCRSRFSRRLKTREENKRQIPIDPLISFVQRIPTMHYYIHYILKMYRAMTCMVHSVMLIFDK